MKELNKLLKYISYYEYDFDCEAICVSGGKLHDEAKILYDNIVSICFSDNDEKWALDIALDCVRNFTDEEIGAVMQRGEIFNYHFGYGMYVRNRYIHKNKLHIHWISDNVSRRVEELICAIIFNECNISNQ